MERRYREISLKRRLLFKRIVICAMVFLLVWLILQIRAWSGWERVWEIGTNCMEPAIFKYERTTLKERNAPFIVWLTLPRIFAYTWQENVPDFEMTVDENEKTKDKVVTASREKTVIVALNQEKELSLLQENIYTSNRYGSGLDEIEDVVNRFPVSKYVSMAELIKDYYIIDASTSPDSNLLQVDYMANYDCTISKETEGPQILIYHSHSQEGFADSVPGDENTTIVGAGMRLTALLEEYGFKVLHHKGVYDVPSRDNAYSNALSDVERILEENPSIQVVIDLHRDAVNEGTKLVKTINGKNYARFMFFNGLCRSTKGPITYLNNPYLKENLAFSFQAQTVAENYFPGITRKIYLKAWRYNMHLRPRNMLIELGAQTNTVEEIMNTCELLAFVINQVLSGQ